jgi:hypothetical protein
VIDQIVTPQAMIASLSKQGMVSRVAQASYINVLKSTDLDTYIHGVTKQKASFIPIEQCTSNGRLIESSKASSLKEGYWLTNMFLEFSPMEKMDNRI